MRKMLTHGYLQDISVPKSDKMTWEKFARNIDLIETTKKIAALKFQEYIIRKLSVEGTNRFGKDDLGKKNKKKSIKTSWTEKYEDESKEKEKFDWYVQWRNNNLK